MYIIIGLILIYSGFIWLFIWGLKIDWKTEEKKKELLETMKQVNIFMGATDELINWRESHPETKEATKELLQHFYDKYKEWLFKENEQRKNLYK